MNDVEFKHISSELKEDLAQRDASKDMTFDEKND